MRDHRIALILPSLVVLVSVPFDLLPFLRGPAPYPPEWQWAFRPEGPARPLLAAALAALSLLGLLWLSFVDRVQRWGRGLPRLLIAGAVLLGCGFQIGLLAREPGHPLGSLLARTRSRSFTSYHTVAISPEARDPRAFVRGHAASLPDLATRAKHAATHPPGPVLYYRAALAVCESSPGLTDGLLKAAGVPDREFRAPATRAARGAALLGALLLVLLGALTAWPVAMLARGLGAEEVAAARLAVVWALLPGPALMTPQFDQALALPVTLATWLLLSSGAPTAGLHRVLLAGLLGGLAIFTSYGAAVFLAVGGVAALMSWERPQWRRRALVAGGAATVSGLVAFGVPAFFGHEPLRALVTALAIHREAYTAPRSYPLWLVFNPLDFALFIGVPLAVLACTVTVRLVRKGVTWSGHSVPDRYRLALAGGFALLVLLGVTRGEVGRLWIPLMPLVLVAACGGPVATRRGDMVLTAVLLAALTLTMGRYWIT